MTDSVDQYRPMTRRRRKVQLTPRAVLYVVENCGGAIWGFMEMDYATDGLSSTVAACGTVVSLSPDPQVPGTYTVATHDIRS
jgi:hypothetical protein